MSMFRKPKKPMLRKVFADDEEKMDIDEEKSSKDRDSRHRDRDRDKDKHRNDRDKPKQKVSTSTSSSSTGVSSSVLEKKPKALLSFCDDVDDEEGEVFQVKKSSHSKKVSRMLDKERRKKAKEERHQEKNRNGDRQEKDRNEEDDKPQKADNIQTEIRTDDFVVSFW